VLICKHSDQQCSIKLQLDRLENKELSLSAESAALLSTLREGVLKAVTQLVDKGNQDKLAETHPNEVRDGMLKVQQLLQTLSSTMTAIPKENIILQHIFFSSMNSREQNMDSAEEGTFAWIFEEEKVGSTQAEDEPNDVNRPKSSSASTVGTGTSVSGDSSYGTGSNFNDGPQNNSRSPSPGFSKDVPDIMNSYRNDNIRQQELAKRLTARTNFTTWLREGGGIFHISGKAGSGKSTLMKFLCSHERTKEELRVWAGKGKKAVFARFYFWKSSGDNLQMSMPGLHRSILFETLKYCPYLIPELFQRQWEMLSNDVPYVPGDFINYFDVRNAFEALTAKASFPQHRFCFFVDGLDEHEGHMTDQVKLARDLQRWASGGDVKICASSRPYIQFDKLVPSDDRRIYLHELTRHDIYLFSRKMIENSLKDDLERVRSYYLSLVEKVVERSEGVFLWARLVICSLLEGMFRHDKEAVLEHKLEVSPPDINGLYTELLNTLSPDDRVRAEKMMLLTAHNVFYPPLSSVVYAFIDQLSDLHFPPRDGKKPVSWGSTDETAEDVQLQLKSLTKGLLETVPFREDNGYVTGRCFVQFFHRTVRDFVLENSKLNDTARNFQNLTKVETYYRLWLAELILEDLPARVKAWNALHLDFRLGFRLRGGFPGELPFDLLEGFSRVVEDGDTISKPTIDYRSKYVFRGISCKANLWYSKGRVSFVSLAACIGQREYVLQKTTDNPELLRGNGESHVLLSAALNGMIDVVRALLQKGSSPMDCVSGGYRNQPLAEGTETEAIPIWVVFLVHLVAYRLKLPFVEVVKYQILELFLQDQRVDASNCWFLLSEAGTRQETHFMTLEQFIQGEKPNNMDKLLVLLKRGNGSSYVNSAAHFLSKFTPFLKETKPALYEKTCGYIPFHLEKGKGSRMRCFIAIYGDLRIDSEVAIKLF